MDEGKAKRLQQWRTKELAIRIRATIEPEFERLYEIALLWAADEGITLDEALKRQKMIFQEHSTIEGMVELWEAFVQEKRKHEGD